MVRQSLPNRPRPNNRNLKVFKFTLDYLLILTRLTIFMQRSQPVLRARPKSCFPRVFSLALSLKIRSAVNVHARCTGTEFSAVHVYKRCKATEFSAAAIHAQSSRTMHSGVRRKLGGKTQATVSSFAPRCRVTSFGFYLSDWCSTPTTAAYLSLPTNDTEW